VLVLVLVLVLVPVLALVLVLAPVLVLARGVLVVGGSVRVELVLGMLEGLDADVVAEGTSDVAPTGSASWSLCSPLRPTHDPKHADQRQQGQRESRKRNRFRCRGLLIAGRT
jgi:hypothetical protein